MSTGGGFIAGSIIGKLLLDKTGWDSSVSSIGKDGQKLQDTAKTIGEKFDQAGAKIQSAGAQMTIFGGAITGAVGLSVKAYGDFDAAMSQSLAIMGNISGETKERMIQAAKDVGRETSISATKAADAYFYLASAGYSADEMIKLLPVASKFAQAGMFSLESATSMLADAQSALGLRIRDDAVANMENMIRVSDVLTKANILSNATIEEFAEALTNRAGAALRLVGKDIEEGAAVLSAFAETGIKGAEAGTRLDIVLRDLQTRAIQNSEVFKKYNVAVFDSNGEMRNMADIISDLEQAMAGQSDEKKRQILMEMEFADRSVASILALIGMSDEIRNYEKELRNAAGATDDITKKQLEAFNEKWKQTKNALHEVVVELGASVGPALSGVFEPLQKVANLLSDFIRNNQGTAGLILGMAGAFGTLIAVAGSGLFVFGSFLKSLGAIEKVFPGFILGAKGAAADVGKLSLAFGSWMAGWNLGRYIGEVTGLDANYQSLFEKAYKFLGIAKGIDVQWGEGHTAAEAVRQEALALALEQTGFQAKNIQEAIDLLVPIYQQVGTTGSEAIDKLCQAHVAATEAAEKLKKGTDDLKGSATDLGAILEAFGLKSKTALTAELRNAESALAALKASTEATPGAVKALEDKIKDLNAELTGASKNSKSLKDEFNLLFPEDLRKRIANIDQALSLYKGKLDPVKEIALREEQEKLKETLFSVTEEGKRLNAMLAAAPPIYDSVIDPTGSYSQELEGLTDNLAAVVLAGQHIPPTMKQMDDAFKNMADEAFVSKRAVYDLYWQLWQYANFIRTGVWAPNITFPDMKIPASAKESVNEYKQAFATMLTDIARGWSETFVKMFGLTDALIGKATQFNREYYDGCFDDLQKDYEARKAAIEANITDEGERKLALADLDAWYASEKERVQTDMEKSEKDHAESTLARQNSLWTKVKTVFGNAVEGMLTAWMVRLVTPTLDSITNKIFPAIDSIGNKGVDVGTKTGNALSGIADGIKGICTAILDVIEDIAKTVIDIVAYGLTTLAEAIATAATSLAAAAPSLLIVGAVALALYAGFRAINELIGSGGGGSGDGMGRVVERQDRFLAIWDWWAPAIADILAFTQGQNDHRSDQLDNLASCINTQGGNIVNAIHGIAGAASGAVSTRTQLMMVHGSLAEPEYVVPHNDLGRFVAGMNTAATKEAGAAPVPQIHIKPILIDKGGKWMIEFIQETINHHGLYADPSFIGG